MTDLTTSNFGLLIAYLLPGFTVLWGLGYLSADVRGWLGSTPDGAPTVGGFLYVTIASVAAGMAVSVVRWLIIDTLHHHTGIRQPALDFSRLQQNVHAFDMLVEIHYRYYQFYGHELLAILCVWGARRIASGFWTMPFGWFDIVAVLLSVAFYFGSRDTLRKYYARTAQFLIALPPDVGVSDSSDGPSAEENDRRIGRGKP